LAKRHDSHASACPDKALRSDATMTIYAHVSLDEKRKAMGKLGEALG
jgi:hypothetical protein